MAAPVSLPEDIWRHVSQFMSHNDLCGVMGANSALFHLAMDSKYRNVSFCKFEDIDGTMQRLRRLREPAIAPRVRCLRVELVSYVWRVRDGPRFDATLPKGVVQTLADTMSFLFNVAEFSISWSRVPSKEEIHLVLATAWGTFGWGLRKLILGAPLEQFKALPLTTGMLPALQELEMDMYKPIDTHNQINVLAIDMAPFFKVVASTLQSVSLLLPAALHVDQYFLLNSLGNILNLRRLKIFMDFHTSGLTALSRILRNHAGTLRCVKLIDSQYVVPEDHPFVAWMKENISDEDILSNLHALETPVPTGPHGFDLVMGYIWRSANTLTSLTLSDSFLSHDEVNTVVSLFTRRDVGNRLEELSFQVKFLTPEVVLTIARKLPQLHSLIIAFGTVAGTEEELQEPEDEDEEFTYARKFKFAENLRKHDIRSWKLNKIGIISNCFTESGLDWEFMYLLAERVPSIRRFFGEDTGKPEEWSDNNLPVEQGAQPL